MPCETVVEMNTDKPDSSNLVVSHTGPHPCLSNELKTLKAITRRDQHITKLITYPRGFERIATVHYPLLVTTRNARRHFGLSAKVDSAMMRELRGNYEEVPTIPAKGIVIRTTPLTKTTGIRLTCTTSKRHLEEGGVFSNPKYMTVNAFLNIRQTILHVIEQYTRTPVHDDISIISIDLRNAYSNIDAPYSNVYLTTSDHRHWHCRQPLQGLAVSGKLAPHLLFRYYGRLNKTLKRRFKNTYYGLASYSDNAILTVSSKDTDNIIGYLKTTIGQLYNVEQQQILHNNGNTYKILGFRWSIRDNILVIRKPRVAKISQSYYIHLLGRRNVLKVKKSSPLRLYTDAIGNETGGIATATLHQDWTNEAIFGLTRTRRCIDQLIAEIYALRLGDTINKYLKHPLPIRTDCNVAVMIRQTIDRATDRQSLERDIIRNVTSEMEFVSGSENKADIYTRQLYDIFWCKRNKEPNRPASNVPPTIPCAEDRSLGPTPPSPRFNNEETSDDERPAEGINNILSDDVSDEMELTIPEIHRLFQVEKRLSKYYKDRPTDSPSIYLDEASSRTKIAKRCDDPEEESVEAPPQHTPTVSSVQEVCDQVSPRSESSYDLI